MASARDNILSRLRAARQPFPDAAPRPTDYLPVIPVEDATPAALLPRFIEELERLTGKVYPVEGDAGAIEALRTLLKEHEIGHVLAWDFKHIPVDGLEDALKADGIAVSHPDLYSEDRDTHAAHIREAGAGLVGADAALATTGTLVVSTAPGRGRTPTVLPPRLIAIVTLDQLLPNIEAWLARERASGLPAISNAANIAFITGPSRTGDIEMALVLGVHGPGEVYVIVKQ